MKAGKAAAPRESRSFTVLLVLQLILVAVLVAVQYPMLLERAAARLGGGRPPRGRGRAGAGGARGLKAVGRVEAAVAAAEPPLAPDTVWTPRCQLPEDLKPGHGAKAFVDISVSSEFSARSRRDAIREGYARYAKELGMRVRFFVGEAEDDHGRASRGSEAKEFGDLVVLKMMDTYENLTLKSMGMACVAAGARRHLSWRDEFAHARAFSSRLSFPFFPLLRRAYSSKCGNGEFYVKTDDDVFVYPWRLKRRLEKVDFDQAMYGTHLGVYIGNFWVDSRPIRETWHKNYEPKWKGEHFGPYAAGPFYILSKNAVDFVGDNALSLNWKWKNEDMAMGTWMAGADVEFANDWHIKILNWKHFEHPLIAEHNIDVRCGAPALRAPSRCPHFIAHSPPPPPAAALASSTAR